MVEMLRREKFEQRQKESEKARLLVQLFRKEVVNWDNRLIIQEKIAQFRAHLKLEVKSLVWSLR
jgi:glutamyl-tRNA reductase